ncbi:hypothetical protein [Aeoliella mucimassa]|uniref:Uncharacterized protein n=1 Tax=Aeoliella mucimassa TaxID=2527972 RepID=A0A518AHU4_9BACT|nr:hypothetical protein [Aeoliella mucimassa]QDU54306.1 hypothetical protein Pan181_04870 [Aeoliella mucimassa]
MFSRTTRSLLVLLFAATLIAPPYTTRADEVDDILAEQIEELVAGLDADTISERDIAEENLLRLVDVEGVGPEKFLQVLPKPNDSMPASVSERLAIIRKQVETRIASDSVKPTLVTMDAVAWSLEDTLKELEKQTGNKIICDREENLDTGPLSPGEIVLQVKDEPFWSVMDQVMDQAKLSMYPFAGENAVSLVERGEGEGSRFGRANYTGPFRFEATEISAIRGLRQVDNQALNIDLEISWEPRLRPIAITQSLDQVDVVTAGGNRLDAKQSGRVYNIEVQEGSCASTITMPFALPSRDVDEIMLLGGSIRALMPGKREKFRFDELSSKEPIVQTVGGVKVTLERVFQNGPVWEVHMSFVLEDAHDALASHRGWVFNNLTYLVGADGEPIDHAGFEVNKQTRTEIGIAYLFDLPDGVEGLSWVYESPVSIVEQEYKFQLEGVKLP